MGEVVNLRLARKAHERRMRDAAAAANRSRYGRTKAEKAAEEAAKSRATATLDGAKRED